MPFESDNVEGKLGEALRSLIVKTDREKMTRIVKIKILFFEGIPHSSIAYYPLNKGYMFSDTSYINN